MTTASTPHDLIPLVVIGGYLGAGKTTLINQLLAGDHGLRLAIVVNDVGAVNIDADLIAAHDGDTFELTNGCICCSITDDLDNTLTRIVASPEPVDAVIVEASGVAEPSRLRSTGGAWLGTELRTVAVLADAATIRSQVDNRFVGDLVRRQLDSADLIVLNKSDLIEPDPLVAVATWLENSDDRDLLVTNHGRVDIDTLLNARSDPHRGGTDVTQPAGLSLFSTITVENARCWNRADLEQALAELDPAIVRVKGRVRIEGTSQLTVLQVVGATWTLDEYPEPPAASTQLVFVSTGARSELEAQTRPFR